MQHIPPHGRVISKGGFLSGRLQIGDKSVGHYLVSGHTKEADSLHHFVKPSTIGTVQSSHRPSMGYEMSHYGKCRWSCQKYARGYAPSAQDAGTW